MRCVLLCVPAGCQAVWSQRKAVLLSPQLWTPTTPIWESWTWATIIQETQEWSSCLRDWRIQTGDWTLSGMKSPAATTDSHCETLYLDCIWFSVRRSAYTIPLYSTSSCSVQEKRQHSLKPIVTSEERKRGRLEDEMKISDQESYGTNTKVTPLFSDWFSACSKFACLISWPLVLLLDEPLIQTTSHSTLTAEDYQNINLNLNLFSTTSLLCYDINHYNRPSVSDVWSENTEPQIQKISVTHK